MGNEGNIKKLAGTATTTFGSCLLQNVCVNKTLTGTLTINENGAAVGQLAIGTVPGNYHQNTNGTRYSALTIVLSAGDDASAISKVA